MSKYVLDASAVLALLQQEPGAEQVAVVLQEAAMSAVNWSEVLQKAIARNVNIQGMQSDLEALGIKFMPFSVSQADLAAQLWVPTKTYGLSLGDRACLSIALELKATVLTADRAWGQLQIGVPIQVIR